MKSRFTFVLAQELKPFTAAEIGRRAKTTTRTAENWKAGTNGPGWRQTVAMLNDPKLGPAILRAAKRADELGRAPALRPKHAVAQTEGLR